MFLLFRKNWSARMIWYACKILVWELSLWSIQLKKILISLWLQDYANYGLSYLIDYVHGKSQKKPELLQVGVCFLYLSVVNCNYTLLLFVTLKLPVTAKYANYIIYRLKYVFYPWYISEFCVWSLIFEKFCFRSLSSFKWWHIR